jgi:hypothetical protein
MLHSKKTEFAVVYLANKMDKHTVAWSQRREVALALVPLLSDETCNLLYLSPAVQRDLKEA